MIIYDYEMRSSNRYNNKGNWRAMRGAFRDEEAFKEFIKREACYGREVRNGKPYVPTS